MRIKVNNYCNIVTGEHATGFRSFGKTPKPQITVPAHKLRLSMHEARTLAADLIEAVKIAEDELERQNVEFKE